MMKFYSKVVMLVAFLAASISLNAQVEPPVGVSSITDGQSYLFQNVHKLTNWLGHTSWDGALYYNNASEQNHVAFTAIANEDGSWSFQEVLTDGTVKYMVIPSGTDNLHSRIITECPDPEVVPKFYVEQVSANEFRFKVGEGNNTNCIGLHLHMNGSNEYIVANEPVNGGQWYPDFYGGPLLDEYGDPVYVSDESDLYVFADSTTCNWMLVDAVNYAEYWDKAGACDAINNFYNNYVVNGEEGNYDVTYNACVAIYNGEEFFSEDAENIKAMINNKIALNLLIEKVEALETEDRVLLAALETAKGQLSLTSAEDVQNAIDALNNALTNYNAGNGEITSLGQNMSFEDLSSQNGNTTSGIEGAPTGWNVYANGVQLVTADDVRAAGFGAWHGINGDATGAKDGSNIFGIWNGSIPSYELSQTIENLDNGTYTVKAALMVGANGNGSRRTTQRIFANLNSTYFADAADYDETQLDQTEVYGFQGLTEPTTDTELQEMEVRAYVFDGTLTFGVRTDSNIAAALRTESNGAGGDGWFKVDNFRIIKEGYNVEDALEMLNYFTDKIDALVEDIDLVIPESVKEQAEAVVAANRAFDETSEPEAIDAAILSTKDFIGEFNAMVQAYNKLYDAIINSEEALLENEDKLGAGEFGDVIMDVTANWEDGAYETVEEVEAAIQQLADALEACLKSDPIEPGSDLTGYIKNNSFEDLSSQNGQSSGGVANVPNGWNLTVGGAEVHTVQDINAAGIQSWCAINEGDGGIDVTIDEVHYDKQPTDGTHLFGVWNGNVPEVELSQTLKLPKGIYLFTADVMVQYDWSGNCITTQRLFANNHIQMWARESDYGDNFTEDMLYSQTLESLNTNPDISFFSYAGYDNDVSYDYTSVPRHMEVRFYVGEDGVAKIGFRTNNKNAAGVEHPHDGAGWFKIDNCHLYCVSFDDITIPDAIEKVETAESTIKSGKIFDLSGRAVKAPAKGLYIQNGQKFLVK